MCDESVVYVCVECDAWGMRCWYTWVVRVIYVCDMCVLNVCLTWDAKGVNVYHTHAGSDHVKQRVLSACYSLYFVRYVVHVRHYAPPTGKSNGYNFFCIYVYINNDSYVWRR